MVLLLALILAACGSPAPRPAGERPPVDKVQRMLDAGDYEAAARAFETLATERSEPAYLVDAGEAWLAAERIDELRRVVAELTSAELASTELARPLAARRDLLAAEIELRNNLPADALAALPDAMNLPRAERMRLLDLRARALLAAGDPWASVGERRALDALLTDPVARRANEDQMFSALQRMPLAEIDQRMREVPATSELYGWLALARVLKTRLYAGEPLDEALIAWRQRFPDHPAAGSRVNALLSEFGGGLKPPDRVALLLPLSGRVAAAGEAVRDGALLAHFEARLTDATIKIYDTTGSAEGALRALDLALIEGADAIIGPLQKEAVAAIARAAPPVPVLGLNQPDLRQTLVSAAEDAAQPVAPAGAAPASQAEDDASDRFYIFSLAPEDEARRAAELAISEGHRRALIMVPMDDWGRRVGDAFAIRFEKLGGWVVGATQYNPAERDYSGRIRPLLQLTDSELRHQTLERIVKADVRFEPQPRDDVDVIFAAARAEQGRLIRPQLRFHRAGGIPVFATSAVFAGSPDPGRDRDLNGVAFCDAHWMIAPRADSPLDRAALSEVFPGMKSGTGRLFALGADAYRVLPFLGWLRDHPDDRFPGMTGDLWLEGNEVRRSLSCARFISGQPVALDQNVAQAPIPDDA